jgi:hypothetical protein
MSKPWFDPVTDDLLFDNYVTEMPSFKRITEDTVITNEEVTQQWQRVITLLKNLEGMLSPEAKDAATDALCELAVLNVLQLRRLAPQQTSFCSECGARLPG